MDSLVKGRQRLGSQEGGRQELVIAGDFEPLASQVEDGAGVDDEPRHQVLAFGVGA